MSTISGRSFPRPPSEESRHAVTRCVILELLPDLAGLKMKSAQVVVLNMADLIGCVCKIKTRDNELLTLGKISAYLPEEQSMEIVPCEGGELPCAPYSTKVRVSVSDGHGGFICLDGSVCTARGSFWRLSNVGRVGGDERRGYFRIKTRSKALVEEVVDQSRADEKPGTKQKAAAFSCMVTNVSISGLLVAVNDGACCYHIGSKLLVRDFTIGESDQLFTVQCLVKRIASHERLGMLFGCKFADLSEKEIDRLCRAIFTQQRIDIQRERGIH